MHLPSRLRKLCLLTSATAALSVPAFSATLVNDTFTDTDRLSSPTSTNTQWVANGTLTASETGMLWNTTSASNRMVLGHFPTVAISDVETTFSLSFTTGANGATASNLRIALVDGTANGFRTTDGFSSTDASYVGDAGYAIFSGSSNVGGGNTTNLSLRTYQRNTTTSNNLLGTSGEWGDNAATTTAMATSSGATGYFEANTAYNLSIAMSLDAGTLTINTTLSGGNFSGLSYSTIDAVSPTTNFNSIALRLGGGAQFADINLTSFTVTSASAIPEPSAFASLAGLGVLGLALARRRRAA